MCVSLLVVAGACTADSADQRLFGPSSMPGVSASPAAPAPAPMADAPPSSGLRFPGAISSGPPVCEAPEQDDTFTTPRCVMKAAPNSFDPIEQWQWEGGDGQGPPLVANLSDDNGDGMIDLCDTPDVVVRAGSKLTLDPPDVVWSKIHVLDGATGQLMCSTELGVEDVSPAIADLDGDGVPEILAIKSLADSAAETFAGSAQGFAGLVVFDNHCQAKWQVELSFEDLIDQLGTFSISVHDVDADGDPEILIGSALFDHEGVVIWNHQFDVLDTGFSLATTTADLDGNGDLEVITGNRVYRPDGSVYFAQTELLDDENPTDRIGFYPVIANLDDDPDPEIVVAGAQGLFVLEHDGAIKSHFRAGDHDWFDLGEVSPPTVHDFDGDGEPEIALGTRAGFSVFERDLTPLWTRPETEGVLTGATAFDFLGDGVAEAIYADRDELLVFDGKTGDVVMRAPRSGALDYPVVVDVDNDGSAEIVVVSGSSESLEERTAPTVQVLRDRDDRWIPTRRIWNQLNYYVTNVREDGTIPARMRPSWQVHNTFRTNVQLELGGICTPVIPD
jgi:hypothetical protein